MKVTLYGYIFIFSEKIYLYYSINSITVIRIIQNILSVRHLIKWSYIITCKKCGHISMEKLSKEKAKELLHAHIGGSQNCTSGDIELMKVRT